MDENDLHAANLSYKIYMSERELKLKQRKKDPFRTSDEVNDKKTFTLRRYREAKSAISACSSKPSTPTIGKTHAICGYTGHRPRKSIPRIDKPPNAIHIKICGYTGHIPQHHNEE